jgi:hypothetical protein
MFRLGSSSKMHKLAIMLKIPFVCIASADVPAGYTCHMAKDCKSYAIRNTGKIHDAPTCKFRCYAASCESRFPDVRKLHWNNFDALRIAKTSGKMTDLILDGISDKIKVLRIHSFGDFFSDNYFQAWVNVTEHMPKITFFAYTKMLDYMKIDRPGNFSMVYSMGGILDGMVKNEPFCRVVDKPSKKLPVACKNSPADDYNYILSGQSFEIVIHGTQPAKK